jgi:SAM-dependent methyltransferase
LTIEGESAEVAYDRYAPIYDEWNAANDYEMWLGEVLLPELRKLGLQESGWALDVGCGTGRAVGPLLTRGWQVVGCDVSSGMLAEAERKFGSQVPLLKLDARSLPSICAQIEGPEGKAFQLVLMLNDVVNYLLEDGDLEQVFAGIKRNLSPRGLAVFDANTLRLFGADFASNVTEEISGKGWEWHGLTEGVRPGAIYEARISGRGVESHVHRQRHWIPGQIKKALKASGLCARAVLGQREQEGRVLLADPPDEERDAKVVYVAGHATPDHT